MTRLTFLGTKGNIEEESPRHRYSSSLLITTDKTRVMIDFGVMYQKDLNQINPTGLLITHAHPDHYIWTDNSFDTDVRVYATNDTFDYSKNEPYNKRIVASGKSFRIGDITLIAYDVIHSLICPAVGYKVALPGGKMLLYNPDLIDIANRDNVIDGASYYIGDGSCIRANLIRRRGDKLYGHARIATQIKWFEDRNMDKMIFTHLGKETIRKEKEFKSKHPDAILAYDNMEVEIDA